MNVFNIKIKLGKKITMNDIISILGYRYGVSESDYILTRNKVGDIMIFYDHTCVGRGVEVKIDKKNVVVTTLLPATKVDINMTYDIIRKICNYLKTKNFDMNDKKCSLEDIDDLISKDISDSEKVLQEYYSKVSLNVHESVCIISALQPVFLGKEEFYEIENSIDNFSNVLHRLQCHRYFYSSKKYYQRNNNTSFSVYYVYENERTIMLEKPIAFNSDVNDIYVCIPDFNLVKYDDFIKNVKYEKYDSNYVVVCLTDKEINKLRNKYIVDSNNIKVHAVNAIYLGTPLETAFRHINKFYDMDLGIDRINAFNHLAAFIKYAYDNKWLDDIMYKVEPNLDEIMKDINKIRIMLDENQYMDRSIRLNMFKEEYRDFIYEYCINYPSDVDKYTLSVMGKEKYNSEEYFNEAYLFLEYNDEYLNGLGKYIEKAYKKYLKDKKNS